ncbi:hypothetical protein [Hyphomicrobium sp.]|uniref:hypothetical protein n=1 Tax=Hyphomicrobium sp. TaxID=82 RepID=UPI001D51A2D4|nr:hypothetical protein [Hyphomicrobium sp.]MBY0559331.1 hypothetical protein [Hyphomicrobium sp.]
MEYYPIADLMAQDLTSSDESRTNSVVPIVVTLHSAGRGKFTAMLDAHRLVERASSSVIFAACRALVAAGVPDGPARFRHAQSPHAIDAEVKSIHAASKLVAYDRQRSGLRIQFWTASEEE